MIHLLYNILFTLFLLVATPYLFFRALFQKEFRTLLRERWGDLPSSASGRAVWLHAASVGEVLSSIPLLQRMGREFPSPIVLTTMTVTGRETAKKRFPDAVGFSLFPWDHPLIIRRALKKLEPSLLLIAETELWPNLLVACERKGIPAILFSGRISDRTFKRYLFLKPLLKKPLSALSLLLMQTEKDRERITAMGAPRDKTCVAGNIKFDMTPPSWAESTMSEVTRSFGLLGHEPVFIAGSTHSGEEEILARLFKRLSREVPHIVSVLAPRHLDRLEDVERVLRKEEIPWVRRTSFSAKPAGPHLPGQVVLLDTFGELMRLYSLATLVFVGGSLVPVGGHNPLEPLFFKKCVLFGPHMFNFSEISRMLVDAGGAVQVAGEDDLVSHVQDLLKDGTRRRDIGERGNALLVQHRGATEKIFEAIRPYLQRSDNVL